VAERSGDTAFARTRRDHVTEDLARTKAAWRFASRRSPKYHLKVEPAYLVHVTTLSILSTGRYKKS
jgi:hypothetical protein